jgi:prepilin-type processing-associated H-X9-DG protein
MAPGNNPPVLEYAGRAPKSRRPLTIFLFAAAVAFALLILIWVIFPSENANSLGPADVPVSVHYLRQIGQAIQLYSNDMGGSYPDSFRTLLVHGGITSKIFVSPDGSDTPAAGPTTQAIADQLVAGGHLSYVYIGRGLTDKSVTDDTIVAYEKLSISGTGAYILFGDGHVEWDYASYVTQIINKSASGKFPVTMP